MVKLKRNVFSHILYHGGRPARFQNKRVSGRNSGHAARCGENVAAYGSNGFHIAHTRAVRTASHRTLLHASFLAMAWLKARNGGATDERIARRR